MATPSHHLRLARASRARRSYLFAAIRMREDTYALGEKSSGPSQRLANFGLALPTRPVLF